ncbi:hypothetical protein ACRAWD_06525 [Caulobacter segnis]
MVIARGAAIDRHRPAGPRKRPALAAARWRSTVRSLTPIRAPRPRHGRRAGRAHAEEAVTPRPTPSRPARLSCSRTDGGLPPPAKTAKTTSPWSAATPACRQRRCSAREAPAPPVYPVGGRAAKGLEPRRPRPGPAGSAKSPSAPKCAAGLHGPEFYPNAEVFYDDGILILARAAKLAAESELALLVFAATS